VPRVGESEHRSGTTRGLVDTDLLTGRRSHGKNATALASGDKRRDDLGAE
jgi:hypothetical protein